MKLSYIIIIVVILTGIFLVTPVFPHSMWEGSLVSPLVRVFTKAVPPPVPSPGVTSRPKPKTFKFNSGTDLKSELDSVNPQVLDSDFGGSSYE